MPRSRSKSDDTAPLKELARGFRKRTWVTAKLTAQAGARALASSLLPGQGVQPGRSDEASEARAVETARKLVKELDGLKGLMMKLGQMASYVNPTLPPAVREVLSSLQSGSQPMAFEVVAEVIAEELGGSPAELFDHFEEEPFAAASIGQVHHARLAGRELAVKVQYPGVRDAISSDLTTVGGLARLGTALTTALDMKEILGELRERLDEECDYVAEARYQCAFADLLQRWPDAVVPRIVFERSSARVLTSTFAAEAQFKTFSRSASQVAKNRAGLTIFDVAYSSILRRCLYNADPHPGNYLFAPEGAVTFLDFGCVKQFSPATIDLWKRIALAQRAGDQAAFRTAVLETGMITKPKRFDWDQHWKVLDYIYEPFTTPNFRFTHDYVRRSYELLIWNNPNTRAMSFTHEWLWVNRLQWGLNSLLAELDAQGPFDELWWSAIESRTDPYPLATALEEPACAEGIEQEPRPPLTGASEG